MLNKNKTNLISDNKYAINYRHTDTLDN